MAIDTKSLTQIISDFRKPQAKDSITLEYLRSILHRITDLLEHRTDSSDAFDTLYIGFEKFPYSDAFLLSMSGVT